MEDWFRLDNAGKIYPAIVDERNTTLYRFSFEMTREVDPETLQKALEEIMPRFPYFHVRLRKGLFWFYFQRTEQTPRIEKDLFYPCTRYDFKRRRLPFQVYWSPGKIAVEFSHCLADGMGALEFCKALLHHYFLLKDGLVCWDRQGIKVPGEAVEPEEHVDAFREIYDPHIPLSRKRREKAYHLKGKMIPRGEYRITTGSMDFSRIRELAKEKGQGVTGLICTLYMDVFQQLIYQRRAKPAPIAINMPINLRELFHRGTLRNFFITLTPSVDPRLGVFTEEDIARHVNSFLNVEIDSRYVSQVIKRNVLTERNFFVRTLLLPLKELILPVIFHLFGERGYTSGISNMGKISLPPELEERISRVEIIPPPSPGNRIKMTCYSFKKKFYVTFGSFSQEKEVERAFFHRLIKHQIPVKIHRTGP